METAPGNCIVFTYVHKGALDGSAMFEGTHNLWGTLQRSGEPWTFGLYPEHLQDYLAECGLDLMGMLELLNIGHVIWLLRAII